MFILTLFFIIATTCAVSSLFAALNVACSLVLFSLRGWFILFFYLSDPHGNAASNHLALSAVLCPAGWETAASAHEGGGVWHTHGGQVAPGHVQEGLPAHAPGLWHILWFVCLLIPQSKCEKNKPKKPPSNPYQVFKWSKSNLRRTTHGILHCQCSFNSMILPGVDVPAGSPQGQKPKELHLRLYRPQLVC